MLASQPSLVYSKLEPLYVRSVHALPEYSSISSLHITFSSLIVPNIYDRSGNVGLSLGYPVAR